MHLENQFQDSSLRIMVQENLILKGFCIQRLIRIIIKSSNNIQIEILISHKQWKWWMILLDILGRKCEEILLITHLIHNWKCALLTGYSHIFTQNRKHHIRNRDRYRTVQFLIQLLPKANQVNLNLIHMT